LIEAVCIEQKRKDPELFTRTLNISINEEDLKSETNRVLGQAIKLARDCQKDTICDEYDLLNSMICQEKDLDDDDVTTKYDLTKMLHYIGRDYGLLLVMEEFFSWGMKAMCNISKELTMDDFTLNGDEAIKTAKKVILRSKCACYGIDRDLIPSRHKQYQTSCMI